MEQFITWLFENFWVFLSELTGSTVTFISDIMEFTGAMPLTDYNVNLVLFSDTPILTLDAFDLLALFFSIFYSVIFIVIIYKIVKKVFVKITRWNKW